MKTINTIFTYMFVVLLTALLLGCKKDVTIDDSIKNNAGTAAATGQSVSVQNMGTPFSSTNVLAKMDPLNPNNSPLITYNKNSTAGYNLVMIDNGKTNGQTPLNAFKFISVNLNNQSYNIISIKNAAGAEIINSVGRVVRYVFGSNKKLYVATEGSAGGGGHIVEYDAATQTALDLGKPFYKAGVYLDVYSLNVGTDGKLYGGSFGGSGDAMTFRYNYDGAFDVDATALDNVSRYVSYISGDANYTYASCGENAWNLYAINKSTKVKTLLLQNSNPAYRIDVSTHTDAVYASHINTHYKLQLNAAASLGAYNTPQTDELRYSIYSAAVTKNIVVNWNENTKNVSFVLPNGNSGTVHLNEVVADIYPTGDAAFVNNNFFVGSAKRALLTSFNGSSWNTPGATGIEIYSVTSTQNGDVYISGYPKGKLLTYKASQPWTLNLLENTDPFTSENTGTNPSPTSMLQNADAAGNNGAMVVKKMAVTKAGYLIAAGDDDRITSSSGRQFAISSFKNGTVKNLDNNLLAQYQFSGMCLNADSSLAYISAVATNGGAGKIVAYNPATNSIINSFSFAAKDPGNIVMIDSKTIAGFYDDIVYLFDVTTGSIIYQQALGSGQRIYSLAKDAANNVYLIHLYLQATHFKVQKLSFTKTASNTINTNLTAITEFSDSDNDEQTKPTCLTFSKTGNAFFVTGLKSVYRFGVN